MPVMSKQNLNPPQVQAFLPVNLPKITLGRVKAPHVMYFHYASAVSASCCFKKHITRPDPAGQAEAQQSKVIISGYKLIL